MTISTTTSTVTYQGNGATTTFTFPFVADDPDTIQVFYTPPSGVQVLLDPSVYTLVINVPAQGQLWGIGGSVSYPITGSPVVPIAVGTYITITRDVPYEQTTSINNQGAFYPQTVEQGLDLLELQIQQLNTNYEYTLKTPLTDPVPPNTLPSYIQRANGYLAFDANGQPIITSVTPSGGGDGALTPVTTRRISTTGTATINILTSDAFAGVSIYQGSTPNTTLQLPATGGPYPVFDGSLNAGTYHITVLPPAGLTILGQTSFQLAFSGQSVTFYSDGTQILVG